MTTGKSEIKVLLVEDSPIVIMGVEIILNNIEGFSLIGKATDGLQAIEMAQKLNPDVILMDIGLPKIDGIEATRKIKENGVESGILMFTTRDDEEDIYSALSAGADGYITKGSNPETLTSAIKSVSQKAAWLDPLIARVVLGNLQQGNLPVKKPAGKNDYGLTKKELEVLSLIADGLTNEEISEKIVVSLHTAKAHVHNILQKLYTEDRTKAAVKAIKEGLV